MITRLTIKNFKSHRHTDLSLGALNLFAGRNGVGKSSAIQALLLLKQTADRRRLDKGLELKGNFCNIGLGKDALHCSADTDTIGISMDLDGKVGIELEFDVEKSLNSTFIPRKYNPSYESTDDSPIELWSDSGANFQYLSASRWGPKEAYPKDSFAVEDERKISLLEGQGELVAHFLFHYQSSVVDEGLCHQSTESKKLIDQVVAWERVVSKNIKINVREGSRGVYEVGYSYEREGDNAIDTPEFRPSNVGFGVSYSLPIIVAILGSFSNDILIIENPEAHLHAEGQVELAKLCAKAAQAGRQVFIETHSENILNGTLIACKEFEESGGARGVGGSIAGIDRSNVSVFYFDRDETNHSATVERIEIEEGGRISFQPNGFFDQSQKDLAQLLGF